VIKLCEKGKACAKSSREFAEELTKKKVGLLGGGGEDLFSVIVGEMKGEAGTELEMAIAADAATDGVWGVVPRAFGGGRRGGRGRRGSGGGSGSSERRRKG
jgi:hypothetical protein